MSESKSNVDVVRQVRLLLRKKQFDEATSLLQKLLKESPANCEFRELLGTACFLRKDFGGAREQFEQVTKLEPLRASGWINLGAIENKLGEFRKAADALRRGLQKDRKNAEAYYNLGIAQKGLKLNTMAISAYKEAVKHKPDMIDAWVNLGHLYLEMRNFSLAQQCCQAILRLDPESRKAKAMLDQVSASHSSARRGASPFGRLVDEKTLASRQQNAAPRVLDPATRNSERDLIRDITKPCRKAGRAMKELLAERFQSEVHHLQVVILHGDPRMSNPELYEQFVSSIAELREYRRQILLGIEQMRNHLANPTAATQRSREPFETESDSDD